MKNLKKKHVNFNVHEDIKNHFESMCKTNGSNMTHILTSFMVSYINEQSNILQNITHNNPSPKETVKNLYKPAQESKEVDWYGETPSNQAEAPERFGNMVKNPFGVWEQI